MRTHAPEDGDEEAGRKVGNAEGDGGLVLALVAQSDGSRSGYADDPADFKKKPIVLSIHGGPT